MSFLLFLISIVVLDQLLLKKIPIRRKAPKPEIVPPKSKAAGSNNG
jgi:hypothetical protein